MVGAASWDVAFLACVCMSLGRYGFARYILFLDGCFSFCLFSLDCRLHTFLSYQIVIYIDLYIKKGTSIVRGATVLVLPVEDKASKLAGTGTSC